MWRAAADERRFPGAAFSTAREVDDLASDAPCRAPLPPVARLSQSARIASTARASTQAAFPTRGAFHRQVLPARFRGGCPPPFPTFCHAGPASDACSLPALLSHGGARPSTVVTGYSPVVVRTVRRLSTSAIETKCEHNRPIDRSPHTTPKSPSAQL